MKKNTILIISFIAIFAGSLAIGLLLTAVTHGYKPVFVVTMAGMLGVGAGIGFCAGYVSAQTLRLETSLLLDVILSLVAFSVANNIFFGPIVTVLFVATYIFVILASTGFTYLSVIAAKFARRRQQLTEKEG